MSRAPVNRSSPTITPSFLISLKLDRRAYVYPPFWKGPGPARLWIGCVDMCMFDQILQHNYWLFPLAIVVQFSWRSLVFCCQSVSQTRLITGMSYQETSVLSGVEQSAPLLSRPLMDVEIIWCADFPPVSQPRRQSALFLRVFFSAAMICGRVDKTIRTNCSTL